MENEKEYILIVTELIPTKKNIYLGTFIVSQLKHLQKFFNVVVITTDNTSIYKRIFKKSVIQYKIENIIVYSMRYYPIWILVLQFFGLINQHSVYYLNKRYIQKKVVILAKKLHLRYNFKLVHGHEVYVGDEAANVARTLGIPSIFTLHGLYDHHLARLGKKVMNYVISNIKNVSVINAVSKIAAVSYFKKELIDREFNITPDCVDISDNHELPKYWRRLSENKNIILTIGSFVEEKRIEQVIISAAELKKIDINSFVVFIIGKGKLEKYYLELIRKLNLKNIVFIIGQVRPDQMSGYYKSCAFLAHPSIVESFSLVCLEAMATKKTFICTKNAGITEYIKNSQEAFIINPDDQRSLTTYIAKLIKDRNLREKMGELAYRTSLGMTWENQIKKIIKQYQYVINK